MVQSRVTDVHLRGLAVVDDQVVWASGQHNTIIKTTNGGNTWQTFKISDDHDLDLRDIEAFNEDTALVISAGRPCKIYKTIDGGNSWSEKYYDDRESVFFDGMDFWDEQNGIAYGDPIDQHFTIIITSNGGETWRSLDSASLPKSLPDEAGFAASGTGIVAMAQDRVWLATGGATSARVFFSNDKGVSWNVSNVPLKSGEGTGIFSISFVDENNGIALGGNYIDSTDKSANCAITNDGGKTWILITEKNPNGYRSCVAVSNNGNLAITVGRTGSEFSTNHGRTWKHLGSEGYFSCGFGQKTAWAVGRSGKMAKLNL